MANEIQEYIRRAALARNIDPNIALKVAGQEGGFSDPYQRSVLKAPGSQIGGGTENSIGPFQLYISGRGKGLGDAALAAGIDPRKNWQGGVDFALDQARKTGWGDWMGAKKVGITGFTGIGGRGTQMTGMPSTGQPTGPLAPGSALPKFNGTLTVGDAPVASVADAAPTTTPADTSKGVWDTFKDDGFMAGMKAMGNEINSTQQGKQGFQGILSSLGGGGGSSAPKDDPIIQTGAIQSSDAVDQTRMANAQQIMQTLLAKRRQMNTPMLG